MRVVGRVVATLVLFAAGGCQEPVEAELALTLTHPEPLVLREVLVQRFREATAKGTLLLGGARAVPSETGVELTLVAKLETCDEATLSEAMRVATELATGAGNLAIHEASPDGARQLANHLRERLATDVRVPFERQGTVVVKVPDDAVLRDFEAQNPGLRVLSTNDEHWVVSRVAALTSADLGSTERSARQEAAVDLVFRDEAVATLRELTERSRMRPLPILIDGQLVAAPVLASRAAEGRLRLDLGQDLALAGRLAMVTLTRAPVLGATKRTCRTTTSP
jgi:hypothetical protein